MTAEQIYSLGMMQIGVVFFLASFRIYTQPQHQASIRLLQWLFFFDACSWLFYLWLEQPLFLALSSFTSAINVWLVLAFALQRAGRMVRWSWIMPLMCVHGCFYSYFTVLQQQSWMWHGQTLFTWMAILPACWLFWRVKQPRTVSDQLYVFALLIWMLVCLTRSILLLLAPEFLFSSLLVSQAIWPGVMVAYGIFAITSFMEEAELKLKADALHDPLTGLLNRRGMFEAVRSHVSLRQRCDKEAALMMIDVDFFKQINDAYGHDIGDAVLVEIADSLALQLRESDVLARFGGEEFVIFLPQTAKDQSQQLANRLLDAVGKLTPASLKLHNIHLSISIGIAPFGPHDDFASRLKKADQALYLAKHNGRGRIEFAMD